MSSEVTIAMHQTLAEASFTRKQIAADKLADKIITPLQYDRVVQVSRSHPHPPPARLMMLFIDSQKAESTYREISVETFQRQTAAPTFYAVSVTKGGENWTVRKRFRSVVKLRRIRSSVCCLRRASCLYPN